MAGKFTINETVNTLMAIFEKHRDERVCVIGTPCVGKSTLLEHLPENCEDLDAVLWPFIPQEDMVLFNELAEKPWTKKFSDEIDRLIYKYSKVKPGRPLFTSVIVDCEAVVYLDISDELLAKHCEKRGSSFEDSKKIKTAIESDWNNCKEAGGKLFYYLTVTE